MVWYVIVQFMRMGPAGAEHGEDHQEEEVQQDDGRRLAVQAAEAEVPVPVSYCCVISIVVDWFAWFAYCRLFKPRSQYLEGAGGAPRKSRGLSRMASVPSDTSV